MIVGPDGKTIKSPRYDGTGPQIVAAFLVFGSMRASTFECSSTLISAGILSGWAVMTSTLLPSARNKIVTNILENFPSMTHILFVDDDMGDFNPDHVKKLVEADVDVIAPLMVRRYPPFQPVCNPLGGPKVLIEEIQKDPPGILECEHVGTGVLLVKRKVFETCAMKVDLVASDPHNEWFTMDRYEDPEQLHKLWKESKILPNIRETNERDLALIRFTLAQYKRFDMRGEDVFFSHLVRRNGMKIYVHMGVQISHLGTYPFHIGHWVQNMKDKGSINVRPDNT